MNIRESPLPNFTQSPQPNQSPTFLPPNHLMRKREELAYQFSDADESTDSHHASAQGTTSVGALVTETQNILTNANNNLLTIPRENYHHHDQLFTLGKLDSDSQRSNSGITPTHLQAATASVQNIEVSSPTNTAPNGGQVQEKKLQTQLEASQSRLFNLAKKIDACLSVSKTNYTESKVLQPATDTSRTVSKTSLNEIKDQKSLPPLESARSEKLSNQLGAPEIIIKPEIPSTTSCEGIPQKIGNLARMNTIESQLMKTDPDQPPMKSSRTKTEINVSLTNSWRPLLDSGSKSVLPNNFKQFETTSSLNIESTNDIPKAKESYLFAKIEASLGNTPSPIPKLKDEEFTLQKNASKDTFKLDTSKDEIQRTSHRQNKNAPPQVVKSPTAENRFSFSNPITNSVKSSAKKGGSQTENKETVSKNNNTNANKSVPKLNNLASPRVASSLSNKTPVKSPKNYTSPKASSANKTAAPKKEIMNKKPASVSANKNTSQKVHGRTQQRSHYEFDGDQQHIDLENDIPEFMSQEDLSPPVPQKLETKNAEFPHISNPGSPQNAISKTNPKPVIAPFKAKKMNFPVPKHKNNLELLNNFTAEAPFELTQTISPVLNDRKSSRGMTSAYQFDAPNLSIDNTKNISFESSVFLGKESIVKAAPEQPQKQNNVKETKKPVRRSETFKSSKPTTTQNNNLQKNNSKPQAAKSKSRGLSTGKNEREYYDDELEGSFVKAYTVQKNKVIKDVNTFEERMDSDVYFRRKFKNDLQQFLDQYKPTLTEEEAQDLYDRLVVDSKRREVKQHRLEIQKEKSNKAKGESLKSLPEEQISQTFDRLAGDARRRMFVQEEKEKMKIIKLQQEFEKFEQEKNSKKLKPEDEEVFVSKMMHDANRRKIKLEKEQRMKFETEEREIQERANQKFVTNNNRAKSKVREYIETQPDLRAETAKSQGPNSRSVPRTKSAKSIRATNARKGSDTIPDMIENPDFFDKRFVSPKNRFLSIASPPNKIKTVKESPPTGKKTSPPPKEDLTSLEYLQSLRKDIDQYRSNIEDNINTIQSFDSGPTSPPRNHPLTQRAPEKTEEKKLLINGLVSPRNPDRTSYKNKYKNVESKVAKHIENITTHQTDSSIAHELKSHRATPQNKAILGSLSGIKSGASSKKSLNNVGTRVSSRAKLADVEEKERKSNTSSTNSNKMQNKFMNAQNAINFVEKLISDFKVGNKV